jgi:hypothetical protein
VRGSKSEKQIPCGDDNQRGKSKSKSKSKGKGKGRGGAKAKARQSLKQIGDRLER